MPGWWGPEAIASTAERSIPPHESGAAVGREVKTVPGGSEELSDALAEKSVKAKIVEFKKNPPKRSFDAGSRPENASLKGREGKVSVRTSLNIRDERGMTVGVLKPGESVKLTGEFTGDGRFVGIEGKDGKKNFVARTYLTISTAPKSETERQEQPKEQKTEQVPETARNDIEKTTTAIKLKVQGKFDGTFIGEFRRKEGNVIPVKGKLAVGTYSYEGDFKEGVPDGKWAVDFGGQKVSGTFRNWNVIEGKGSINGKEGEFKYAADPSGKPDKRVMTFTSGGEELRYDDKSGTYLAAIRKPEPATRVAEGAWNPKGPDAATKHAPVAPEAGVPHPKTSGGSESPATENAPIAFDSEKRHERIIA